MGGNPSERWEKLNVFVGWKEEAASRIVGG